MVVNDLDIGSTFVRTGPDIIENVFCRRISKGPDHQSGDKAPGKTLDYRVFGNIWSGPVASNLGLGDGLRVAVYY